MSALELQIGHRQFRSVRHPAPARCCLFSLLIRSPAVSRSRPPCDDYIGVIVVIPRPGPPAERLPNYGNLEEIVVQSPLHVLPLDVAVGAKETDGSVIAFTAVTTAVVVAEGYAPIPLSMLRSCATPGVFVRILSSDKCLRAPGYRLPRDNR